MIPEIISSPGLVKVHEGSTAQLLWETDEDAYEFAYAHAYHTSVTLYTEIVTWFHGETYFSEAYRTRAYSLKQGTSLGFAINNTQFTDALNYILVADYGEANRNATIYVYSKLLTSDQTNPSFPLSLRVSFMN